MIRVFTGAEKYMTPRSVPNKTAGVVKLTSENKPCKKILVGNVRATIWENESKFEKGKPTHSVTLEKVFRDKSNQWQSNNSFNQNEIPKAVLALEKAYEFVMDVDRKNGDE